MDYIHIIFLVITFISNNYNKFNLSYISDKFEDNNFNIMKVKGLLRFLNDSNKFSVFGIPLSIKKDIKYLKKNTDYIDIIQKYGLNKQDALSIIIKDLYNSSFKWDFNKKPNFNNNNIYNFFIYESLCKPIFFNKSIISSFNFEDKLKYKSILYDYLTQNYAIINCKTFILYHLRMFDILLACFYERALVNFQNLLFIDDKRLLGVNRKFLSSIWENNLNNDNFFYGVNSFNKLNDFLNYMSEIPKYLGSYNVGEQLIFIDILKVFFENFHKKYTIFDTFLPVFNVSSEEKSNEVLDIMIEDEINDVIQFILVYGI